MKLESTKESGERNGRRRAFRTAGAASGQNIPAQISAVKAAIFAESYPRLNTQARLLWLALNEAEAAAWQTRYPQLVFPTLATEKVEAVIAWEARQRVVQRASPVFALAA
jgi:hypothetical protein